MTADTPCPDDDDLRRLVFGLPGPAAAGLEAHFAGCAACAERATAVGPGDDALVAAARAAGRAAAVPDVPTSVIDRLRGFPAPPRPADEVEPGRRVGAYRIDGVVGRGGMGVVYLARHARLDRPVALKVLPPDAAPDRSARFRREAEAMAALRHPNVIPSGGPAHPGRQVGHAPPDDGRPGRRLCRGGRRPHGRRDDVHGPPAGRSRAGERERGRGRPPAGPGGGELPGRPGRGPPAGRPAGRPQLGRHPPPAGAARDQLEDALGFYQGVLGGLDDPDPEVRLDAAVALIDVATARVQLGRADPAGADFRRAADELERLPAAYRDRPICRGLIQCWNYLASAAVGTAAAEAYVRKSLAEAEALAAGDHPDDRNTLAAAEHNLAVVYYHRRDFGPAEAHDLRAVAIRTALIGRGTATALHRVELAETLTNLGVIYVQQNA